MNSKLEKIIVETKPDPEIAVIWLHGLGADGNDFVPVVNAMDFSNVPGIRFIFPHAPVRPITVNGGMVMRGWYDIADMSIDRRQDEQGVRDSAALIDGLIDEQNDQGIDTGRIFLAGFSQGGAVAFYSGLTGEHNVAGIIALSTYIPLMDTLEIKNRPAIFYAHGANDPVIPIQLANRSHDWLLSQNIVPAWHQYGFQHEVSMQEIGEVNQWLLSRIQDIYASTPKNN